MKEIQYDMTMNGDNINNSVQQDDSEEKISTIIKVILWVAIFLVPIFFIMNTPSALELNKQILLDSLVGIAFLVWVGRMAIKSQIKFRANFIFIPIFIFLFIMGLSTAFADYSAQSLWGFFGGEARSFISLVFFVAFFVLFVNNIKSKKDILISLVVVLASGFVVNMFGLLQLWGKYLLPMQSTHNDFFNSVGSVYLFGVYLSALFLLALTLLIYVKNKIAKIILGGLTVLFFATLTVFALQIVWIALVVSLALILGRLIIGGEKTSSGAKGILPMIFLVLSLLMILHKQPIIKKQLPGELLLQQKASASIAWDAVKHDFLLGSGPANYINVYRESRPLNLGRFWSVNFNTSASYFWTLAATVGILGTLAFLALLISSIVYLFRGVLAGDDEMAILGIGIGGAWILLSIILLFYVVNITILFMWWFMLASFVTVLAFNPRTELRDFSTGSNSDKPSLLFSFIFVLVIIGVVVALFMHEQKYMAAVHFSKALTFDAKGESIESVVSELDNAVLLDPKKDLYYRNRSLAYFAMANKTISEKGKDVTAEDSAHIGQLIKRAIEDASNAKIINPNDVDNYMASVRIYESLLPTMEGAGKNALEYAEAAVKFDPNNPSVYQRLSNIYISMADLETIKGRAKKETELSEDAKKYLVLAKENAKKTIDLNQGLLSARLLLVSILNRDGDDEGAIKAMIDARVRDAANPNLAFQLGLMYLKGDKLDEALGQFISAIRIDNNYANAHYFTGIILDKKGEKELAIKEFEVILKLNEGNKLVEKILENLKANKSALDGLQQGNQVKSETAEKPNSSEEPVQPSINPEIDENQTIPEEVTSSIKDTNVENTDADTTGNDTVNPDDSVNNTNDSQGGIITGSDGETQ